MLNVFVGADVILIALYSTHSSEYIYIYRRKKEERERERM